ncbi:Clavaminate synthase-like protein [Sistotremastrum suecicum HHB10207 ss-3]|uniref:Clavaminate synthase-like protein n=1 Tax=Sistotremastrum suecicum HHB10207 ss-3 TaxID=1314776 RepID=A0A166B652_9AGAM|nr:Clavaminate synthase-like protein [Sistotremastrum suecicum HHB10207 ss-3]
MAVIQTDSALEIVASEQRKIETRPDGAVVISYHDLVSGAESLVPSITQAFGDAAECLGLIIVKDLPQKYKELRESTLLLADRFAALDEQTKEKYTDPASQYSFGWSHGKEIMNGKPDTLKGSYYANITLPEAIEPSAAQKSAFPQYYSDNIWPSADEKGVEGFEDSFKSLGQFIFSVGCLLARACQPFVSTVMRDQSSSLYDLIAKSGTVKARLLHYFPPKNNDISEDEPQDNACGYHLDHSMLTGLCSAMYLAHNGTSAPIPVPSPSPVSGLYIKTRGGQVVKASIPEDCLAFQTGEALQVATDGLLRATPHYVRVGENSQNVSRETFALFMGPDTEQNISETETFGEFSKRKFDEHYAAPDDAVVS